MPDDFNRGITGSLRHVDTKIGKKGNPRNKKEKGYFFLLGMNEFQTI